MTPILELDTVDSTNNYAMRLIDADTAESGLMILANAQTSGKGQRGKQWMSAAGESLLMSLILRPNRTLQQQTQFMAAVAVSVAKICEQNLSKISVKIKWPNDIIIADKKAGGILIENMIRGTSWEWSVIGIGLNIQQRNFPANLPFATSLAAHGAHVLELKSLAIELREEILAALHRWIHVIGAEHLHAPAMEVVHLHFFAEAALAQ